MSAQITASEMLESLTGYDEIAIATHFGSEALELAEKKPTMLARAMAFVHMTREGQSTSEAKKAAMTLSIRAANEYFVTSEDEPMPEEPVTEEGKDGLHVV
jgi:hypothetical protein